MKTLPGLKGKPTKAPEMNDPKLGALVKLVRENPGLDAPSLRKRGWRRQTHASLRDAEQAKVIVWRNEGWYAV